MPEMETTPHVLRVGWSVEESSLQLGEDRWSYGYGGTGKVSTNNKFVSYGQAFAAGDVITCYLDLDSTPQAMFYSVNGVYQGVAFTLEQSLMGKSLLPHVTVKNMRFRLNFGASPPSFPLTSGFRMLEHTARDGYARRAHIGPARRENAEVLMLVGLPAAGKTYWVEHFIKDYPDKHYCVLGTNNIIDKMRIMGLSRKRNYHGRWDALIKQATGILNKLLKIAEKRVRNYIIDQTNVYASARQRKMRPFHGYRRIAVVVVNDNQTLITRAKNREEKEGKVVPQSAVMDMKQNFSVPQVGDSFDEVWFVDCEETRARELVMEFNIEGRRLHGQTETKSHEPSKGQSHDLRNNQDPYAEKPIYSESSSWFHEPRLNPDRQQTSGQDRNYGSIPPSNHEPSGPSQVLPRHSQAPYCGAPRNVRPPPPINPGHLPRAHGPSDGPYKGPHQGYQPRGQHTTHFQPYLPQMHPHQRMLNPWSGSGQWRNPPPRLPYPHQIPPRGY